MRAKMDVLCSQKYFLLLCDSMECVVGVVACADVR